MKRDEPPTYQMWSVAQVGAIRSFPLGVGLIKMAQALEIVMDQGLLALAGLCAAQRVNPWILFAAQFGTPVSLETRTQMITRRTSSCGCCLCCDLFVTSGLEDLWCSDDDTSGKQDGFLRTRKKTKLRLILDARRANA